MQTKVSLADSHNIRYPLYFIRKQNVLNCTPDVLAHFRKAGLHALPGSKYAHSTNLVEILNFILLVYDPTGPESD